MATQVPYQPVPDVGPGFAPTPRADVNTPPDAFGAATAAATQHLGEVDSQVGNELFQRAVAMQQLDQDTKATEAVTDYTTQIGQKFAAFSSLSGKAAADGYQPFLDDINQTRQNLRGQLQSPYAQHAYDQESRFLQARMAMSGAMHAGEQLKTYSVDTSKAAVESNINLASVNPRDDDTFDQLLAANKSRVHQQAVLGGYDNSPQETLQLQKTQSDAWSSRIHGLAMTNPFAADRLLAEAQKSGAIVGSAVPELTQFVQSKQNTIGVRNIAREAMTGSDLSWGAKPVSPELARGAITNNEADKRGYSSEGPTVTDKEGNSGHALGAYQVMDYNLKPWLAEAGMPSMTPAEFLANHQAQDQLFDFKFGQYQQKYGSFNSAAQAWFGGEGSVGKANISDGYHTGAWYLSQGNQYIAQHATTQDLDSFVRGRAADLAPNNPDLPELASQRVVGDRNRQFEVQRVQDFQDNQTLYGALVKGRGQDGKLPTSVEELEAADPDFATAWDRAQPTEQQKIYGVLAQNAKGDYAATPQNQSQFRQILGQLTDPQMTEAERDKALNTDIATLPMPAAQRQELLARQGALFNHMESNPDVTRALGQVADITRGVLDKTNDPDDYYKFYGAFEETIKDQMEQQKRPLKVDEVRSIAQGLIKQTIPGGWFSSPTLAYQMPVPDDFRTRAVAVARANGQPEPTDTDLYTAYQALQYRNNFGKSNGRSQ